MKVKFFTLRKMLVTLLCVSCATMLAVAFAACGEPKDTESALSSGTYWAEQEFSMGGMANSTYVVHVTLDDTAKTYYFSTYFVLMGATYYKTESGTYTDDGTTLTLNSENGAQYTAEIGEDSFTLDRNVSGMGSSTYELTYVKGDAPIYVTYYDGDDVFVKIGYKNATDAVVPVEGPEKEGYTFDWTDAPETAGSGASVHGTFTIGNFEGLISGNYDVDVSWNEYARYSPVLVIDAAKKTFNIWNGDDREENKGTGTISYEDGVFTLKFKVEEGAAEKTTTFTYDAENFEITFTSKLWYGSAALNRIDDDGEFVPYTATLHVDA